jgi:protein-S-isoprenylcysteine O-methyltransferase Ste14
MNVSRSTPRIRFTQVLYLVVIGLAALSDGRVMTGLAGALAQLVGLMFVSLAALGRLWTSLFIAGRKDLELVTDGPYSVCRNPLYGLSLLGAGGIGLASRSLTLTVALPAVLAVVFTRAIRAEESYLATLHAADYAAYRAAVPRYWPDRTHHRPRLEARVPTRIYYKAFLDAASFLLLYVLVVAADLLADHDLTPTPIVLP